MHFKTSVLTSVLIISVLKGWIPKKKVDFSAIHTAVFLVWLKVSLWLNMRIKRVRTNPKIHLSETKNFMNIMVQQCPRFSELWMKLGCNAASSKIKAAEPQKASKREQRTLDYKWNSHTWKFTFYFKKYKVKTIITVLLMGCNIMSVRCKVWAWLLHL